MKRALLWIFGILLVGVVVVALPLFRFFSMGAGFAGRFAGRGFRMPMMGRGGFGRAWDGMHGFSGMGGFFPGMLLRGVGILIVLGLLALGIFLLVKAFRYHAPAAAVIPAAAAPAEPAAVSAVAAKTCASCGQAVQSDWKVCPYCGNPLQTE